MVSQFPVLKERTHYSTKPINIRRKLLGFTAHPPCRAVGIEQGAGGHCSLTLADKLTLLQTGVQIMPTTLLLAPPPKIFISSYGPAMKMSAGIICFTLLPNNEKKSSQDATNEKRILISRIFMIF